MTAQKTRLPKDSVSRKVSVDPERSVKGNTTDERCNHRSPFILSLNENNQIDNKKRANKFGDFSTR